MFSDTPCYVRTHILLPHSTSSLSPIDGKLCGDRKSIFFLCVLSRSHKTWHTVCATHTLAEQLCSQRALCSYCCCLVTKSCPTLLWLQRLWPTRLLCQWHFPGKNTWVVISSSRVSSPLRDQTHIFCLGRWVLYHWGTEEAHKALLLLFNHSVVSDSLWPHGPQHTRIPSASLSPRACPNSCPLNQCCHPTISSSHPLLFLPSIFPSIRVFSNESALPIRRPKYWSFSISSSNEYSGLISFTNDCFDVLALQGILKSLLQHHSSKASFLQCSAFLIVQLSHPYMTTGKTTARLCRHLLAKWYLWFLRKSSLSLFPLFPFYFPWSEGTGCHDLRFLNVKF